MAMAKEFKNYSEQYLDPRWQKKRLEVLQRDDFTCQHCASPRNTLHVHHRYYKPNKDVWDYPLESLTTLCEECHKYEEDSLKIIDKKFIQILKEAGCESLEFGLIMRVFEKIKDNKIYYPLFLDLK